MHSHDVVEVFFVLSGNFEVLIGDGKMRWIEGAEETQIVASFREAIRIAKEQKSISLEKRAEATYAEYRRQKASGAGARGFRLPL